MVISGIGCGGATNHPSLTYRQLSRVCPRGHQSTLRAFRIIRSTTTPPPPPPAPTPPPPRKNHFGKVNTKSAGHFSSKIKTTYVSNSNFDLLYP